MSLQSPRVALISKALLVGVYQRKAEEIARLGVDLTVLTPRRWQDRRGVQSLQMQFTAGYTLRPIPLALNGNYHLHFYPTLARELARIQPHLVHVDEEPYNLATWLAVRGARRVGARVLFFTWQNLYKRYPPPFRWWERAVYRACAHAIAGNQEAAQVLRRKGFAGPISVIPQFGVDAALFAPGPARGGNPTEPFHIGYAGGLLPEKGLDLLLRACAGLHGPWRLSLVGDGEARQELLALAHELGVAEQVHIQPRRAGHAMPDFYRSLDAFVLPSRTRSNWKEQFGRVLIEAMACAVPVVGSDSGEIPNVIGDAGLIFPEEDVPALTARLQALLDRPEERRRLGQAGRARVLAHFTMERIAQATVDVYRQVLA